MGSEMCIRDRGFAPDPTGRAYSTLPVPLARFKGPTSREGETRGESYIQPPIFWSSRRLCITYTLEQMAVNDALPFEADHSYDTVTHFQLAINLFTILV